MYKEGRKKKRGSSPKILDAFRAFLQIRKGYGDEADFF